MGLLPLYRGVASCHGSFPQDALAPSMATVHYVVVFAAAVILAITPGSGETIPLVTDYTSSPSSVTHSSGSGGR